jgi:hypothetical protein
MCDCGSGSSRGKGPYATGRELVEFVLAAHGGRVAGSLLPGGALPVTCQECGEGFELQTFVQGCPTCGGVHAVSPPRADDPGAVQYAGAGFGALTGGSGAR